MLTHTNSLRLMKPVKVDDNCNIFQPYWLGSEKKKYSKQKVI